MRTLWSAKLIDELCTILDYKRVPITKKDRIEGNIPYYGATGILSYVNNYIFDEKLVLLGEDGAKWDAFEKSAYIIEGKSWVNNHAHVLRPNREMIIDEYLVYNLNYQNLSKYVSGMTVPKLNQKNLRSIIIPLPPLPIQKQIVQILNEAFAAIDKAKANIQKNIQNAEELIRAFIDKNLSQMNDDNWTSIELSEISKIMYGYTAKASTHGNAKMLRITDIQNNKVNWNEVPFCEISEAEFEKYKLLEGDIVFARTGATTGKSYLITKPPKSVFASYLIRVQVDREKIIPNYLYEFFQSSSYWEIINTGISGSAQGGFNASKLNLLQLAFPKDLNAQKEIVTKINNFRMKSILMKSQYSKKNDQLDELKKTLLQKAFSGELTKEADIDQQLNKVL